MEWKEISPNHEIKLFPTIMKVIKHPKAQHPSTDITFAMGESKLKYKLEFEWQDESVCGITVFKQIGAETCLVKTTTT